MSWNHNTRYHGFVMRALPDGCGRALDVGCGRGALTRTLSPHCGAVVGIDADTEFMAYARGTSDTPRNVTFVNGDVLTYQFQPGGFDFVVAVATLHHLPLGAALRKFSDLLRPGGVLAIVGLYRMATPIDYAFAAAALPTSCAIRSLRGEEQVGAPMQDPTETLGSIRRESASILPGAVLRRRFFFRYTIVWRKPGGGEPY